MTTWTMPKWMEDYRPYLNRLCGGCSVEELMNDHHTVIQVNAPRAVFCAITKSLVSMLVRLHEDGRLRP